MNLVYLNHYWIKMLYDRLAFDFDNEESPATAVTEAIAFATLLRREHGIEPLVFETEFKGAHVVIPLSKPINWEGYRLLWRHFYENPPPATRKMVDLNMLQWNRVDRVLLTYNVKEDGVRFCRVVYPRKFTWKDFNWSGLQPLDPKGVTAVRVGMPRVVEPKPLTKLSSERKRIRRLVKTGLPDGRRRFLFYVLIPYLAVVRQLSEEEVLSICREFLENSCKNHGKCSKVYDSWIRNAIRSAKSKRFRGFSLLRLREKDPDLYGAINCALLDVNS